MIASLFKVEERKRALFRYGLKETLEEYGFHPQHAPYYIVLFLRWNKTHSIAKKSPTKEAHKNTFAQKIIPIGGQFGISNNEKQKENEMKIKKLKYFLEIKNKIITLLPQ